MKIENYIELIEKSWDDDGFLFNVRSGIFAPEEGRKFLQLIGDLDLSEDDLIPKRLLSLMWYLPSFLEWQRERVSKISEGSSSGYSTFIDEVYNVLQKTLGVP